MPRIHLPVFTDRSAISSKPGSGNKPDLGRQLRGQRATGQTGSTIDHHRAGTADAGAADEIETQPGIERLADAGQRDEQRHARRFFQLILHDTRLAGGIARVVAEDES
jgi:hypothetical protein